MSQDVQEAHVQEGFSPAVVLSRIPNSPYFNQKLRFNSGIDTTGRLRLAAIRVCSKD